jgi:hypothetical protein
MTNHGNALIEGRRAYKRFRTIYDCYRALMTSVVSSAVSDSDKDFILGPDCAAYCRALNIEHQFIREQAGLAP